MIMEFKNQLLSSDIDSICNLLDIITDSNSDEILESISDIDLIDIVRNIFRIHASKNKRQYYTKGIELVNKIINKLDKWSTPYISDILFNYIENPERAQKEYAYVAYETLIKKNSNQIKIRMPQLIPVMSFDVNDLNKRTNNFK